MPEAQFGYKRSFGELFPRARRSGIAARSACLPRASTGRLYNLLQFFARPWQLVL